MTTLKVTRFGAHGLGRRWSCAIGRGGISGNKQEGDGATPVGDLVVTACLYRADRIPQPAPWALPISPTDLWCDDQDHLAYNHLTKAPMSASHERLWRADRLYDIILTTDWNWPVAVPGQGSAIFIHRWRKPRHPTEGCIAFSPCDLTQLAGILAPGSIVKVLG